MPWRKLTREECKIFYTKVLKARDAELLRRLCREDLFFLIYVACHRNDMDHDWIFARCREVEASPDGWIDLWARFHYKSTIITFGKTIQDILRNPEETVGIFSHTRPIAKAFLSQIKREFEINTLLKNLFDDILYQDPQKESPCWSMDNGIVVKRKGNPKEATVEAWGLVDGQPTSKHYSVTVYDDVVTLESVTTPDQIEKTTTAWSISLNLGTEHTRRRIVGTRYHAQDTYQQIMDRGAAKPRIYPATVDGTRNGKSVLLGQEALEKKFQEMGTYVASAQLLLNPFTDAAMGFQTSWLEFYDVIRKAENWNVFILVDPASEKKKGSDYTVLVVLGLAPDGNYYLLDGVRDRLNLTERTAKLFELVRKWTPKLVGYEKYGMQADIEHIRYVQEQEGYRFHIQPLGGQMGKNDRIRRLVPLFENRRFYLPRRIVYITQEKKVVDFVHQLINDEYTTFPVGSHDDMMDAISRIMDEDLGAKFPKKVEPMALNVPVLTERYDALKTQAGYNPLQVAA